MDAIKVLVVEDEILIRKYVTSLVELFKGIVVGETAYGEEAVEIAHRLSPDLIMMDIKLKDDTSGIEAAKRINDNSHPHIPIIFMSAYNYQEQVEEAQIPNTIGYLQKPMQEMELKAYFDKLTASNHKKKGF